MDAGSFASPIPYLPVLEALNQSLNLAQDRTYERQMEVKSITMRDPGLAAALSAIVPGVGQFYNGRILAGILWLIITPGSWIGTGGLLGWVCHVIAAYTAYTYARDHRVRT